MDIARILSNDRTSQASIGLTKSVFVKLVPEFDKALGKGTKKNPYRGGRKDTLRTSEEKLFFILFYLKNYPPFMF